MTRIRKAAIAWSALCVIWLIGAFIYASRVQNGDLIGAKGIVVRNGISVWVVGLVIIAFIWFVTRGGPARSAKPSESDAVVPPALVGSLPAAGWYDDAERPGGKRWWDGTAWGIRDDEHHSGLSVAPSAGTDDADSTPAVPGSPPPELDSGPADDIATAVSPAGSPLEAGLENAVVAIALEPTSEAEAATALASTPELDRASLPPGSFCENCGAERRPGARFCSSCGHAH